MNGKILGLAITIIFLACGLCCSAGGDGPGEKTAHVLARHDISTDRESLVHALSSPDNEVRLLASTQMGINKDGSASVDIERALGTETDLRVRAAMAVALVELGDHAGLHSLSDTCRNVKYPVYWRLDAVRLLLVFDDHECFDVVLDGLSEDDSGSASKLNALTLFPQFQDMNLEQRGRSRQLVEKLLIDPEQAVRFTASDTLQKLGAVESLPALRSALTRETEDTVRTEMKSDVNKLERSLVPN